MYYQEFVPPSFLADYVQIIWIKEDIKTDDFNTKERILPDGIVELVFHYGDPYLTHNSIGNTQEQPRSFAISQIQDFIEIQSNGRTGMISVRFFPWGAYHFFKIPIRDFIDDTIETSNLWPHQYSEVQDRIESATNNLQRLNIIKEFLMNSLKENYQNAQLQVFNLAGQRIHQRILNETDNLIRLNVNSGSIYVVSVIVDGVIRSKKVYLGR